MGLLRTRGSCPAWKGLVRVVGKGSLGWGVMLGMVGRWVLVRKCRVRRLSNVSVGNVRGLGKIRGHSLLGSVDPKR